MSIDSSPILAGHLIISHATADLLIRIIVALIILGLFMWKYKIRFKQIIFLLITVVLVFLAIAELATLARDCSQSNNPMLRSLFSHGEWSHTIVALVIVMFAVGLIFLIYALVNSMSKSKENEIRQMVDNEGGREAMNLSCLKCGKRILPADIDVIASTAACRECSTIFEFEIQNKDAESIGISAAQVQEHERMNVPKGLVLSHEGQDLILYWRWFTMGAYALIPINIAVYWLLYRAISLTLKPSVTPLGTGIVGIVVMLTLAVSFTYLMISVFVNGTEIRINPTQIAVRNYPLPSPGNKIVPVSGIDKLYFCKRFKEKSTFSSNAIIVAYENGEHILLASGLSNNAHQRFIIEQIRERLGQQVG